MTRDEIRRIEDVEAFLARCGYVGDREIATALFLAIRLHRPLLVEGFAGVGKTEIAKTLAAALGTTLFRLQCYEGLDASAALYEWNYAKQILRIRMEENSSQSALEKEVEGSRLEMMRRYAEYTGCRRSFLLTYFGQEYPGPCGLCDNDRLRSPPKRTTEPFAVGVRVESGRWGEGTVQRYDGDQVTVLFDDHGYRDLLVPLVLERDLLRPV